MNEDGYFDERVAATVRRRRRTGCSTRTRSTRPSTSSRSSPATGGRSSSAIGTGRIALPLAARGVPVHGIDLSRAMVERLRAKPGGEGHRRHHRRLRDDAGGRDVLARVPRVQHDHEPHDPGGAGRVLPERRGAPRARRPVRDRGRRAGPPAAAAGRDVRRRSTSSETHRGIDEYDVANQGLVSHHFEFVDGGSSSSSVPFRYVWPAELDLMAELAGMRLRDRWAGWKREPFTSESREHVSVWEKPAQ